MVKEVKRIREIITSEFVLKLQQVRTRRLTWIDFVNLFLAIFGVCCTLIVIYLWGIADKKLAHKLSELERLARL